MRNNIPCSKNTLKISRNKGQSGWERNNTSKAMHHHMSNQKTSVGCSILLIFQYPTFLAGVQIM